MCGRFITMYSCLYFFELMLSNSVTCIPASRKFSQIPGVWVFCWPISNTLLDKWQYSHETRTHTWDPTVLLVQCPQLSPWMLTETDENICLANSYRKHVAGWAVPHVKLKGSSVIWQPHNSDNSDMSVRINPNWVTSSCYKLPVRKPRHILAKYRSYD